MLNNSLIVVDETFVTLVLHKNGSLASLLFLFTRHDWITRRSYYDCWCVRLCIARGLCELFFSLTSFDEKEERIRIQTPSGTSERWSDTPAKSANIRKINSLANDVSPPELFYSTFSTRFSFPRVIVPFPITTRNLPHDVSRRPKDSNIN